MLDGLGSKLLGSKLNVAAGPHWDEWRIPPERFLKSERTHVIDTWGLAAFEAYERPQYKRAFQPKTERRSWMDLVNAQEIRRLFSATARRLMQALE